MHSGFWWDGGLEEKRPLGRPRLDGRIILRMGL